MARIDGRTCDTLRPVNIVPDYLEFPTGSVLIEWGRNRIICAATVTEGVPAFMQDQAAARGWLSTEYSLLPYSTPSRTQRESTKGVKNGRTQEIQRLIGRSLRAVVDLEKIPGKTVWVDCDVIQADGGTRTASITGAFVAVARALEKMRAQGTACQGALRDYLAAVSVGMLADQVLLDLCYQEDSAAQVDMNVVMTGGGEFVEIQGTAEHRTFSRAQLDAMLAAAASGILRLVDLQKTLVPRLP